MSPNDWGGDPETLRGLTYLHAMSKIMSGSASTSPADDELDPETGAMIKPDAPWNLRQTYRIIRWAGLATAVLLLLLGVLMYVMVAAVGGGQ